MSTYTHERFGTGTIIGTDGNCTIIDFGADFGVKRMVTALLTPRAEADAAYAAKKLAAAAAKQRKNLRERAELAKEESKDRLTKVKEALLSMPYYRQGDLYTSVMEIVLAVRMETKGFAADVAASVERYGKVSEKQAYVIAKAFCDSNLTVNEGIYAGI